MAPKKAPVTKKAPAKKGAAPAKGETKAASTSKAPEKKAEAAGAWNKCALLWRHEKVTSCVFVLMTSFPLFSSSRVGHEASDKEYKSKANCEGFNWGRHGRNQTIKEVRPQHLDLYTETAKDSSSNSELFSWLTTTHTWPVASCLTADRTFWKRPIQNTWTRKRFARRWLEQSGARQKFSYFEYSHAFYITPVVNDLGSTNHSQSTWPIAAQTW